jgi:hypothetical protein
MRSQPPLAHGMPGHQQEESMAEQELKAAHELEALILGQSTGLDIHTLKVIPDPTLGWGTIVTAHPSVAGEYKAHVDRVAEELRSKYDLKAVI